MNDWIKALAEQAGWMIGDEVEGFNTRLEKFTQLIVRECLVCCEQVISDPVPKDVDTWLNGGSQCMAEIRYHFGIEE
jgi:hypothetical protein